MTKTAEKVATGHGHASSESEEWRDDGMAERNERQARLAARVGLPRFAIRLIGERRVREMAARG
jgi:hypothetical protein